VKCKFVNNQKGALGLMPARKMRIELFDSEGNKYTIAFEGQITREKALRLLDLVELLGGMPEDGALASKINPLLMSAHLSKYDKVRAVIQKNFPLTWFSSREAQTIYEKEFKEPISLSTVATYLSRMVKKGLLLKAGSSNRLKYKLAQVYPSAVLSRKIP